MAKFRKRSKSKKFPKLVPLKTFLKCGPMTRDLITKIAKGEVSARSFRDDGDKTVRRAAEAMIRLRPRAY